MPVARFSEDVRPVTDLRVKASEIVRHVRSTGRPVLLTRRGRGVAVIVDLEEYERLSDRASFIDAVQTGVRAARDGDLHADAEAAEILESFGR